MLAGKARAYLSEAHIMCSTLGQAPYPQTLDQAGKACQGTNALAHYKNS
jgi:hypothetical protein